MKKYQEAEKELSKYIDKYHNDTYSVFLGLDLNEVENIDDDLRKRLINTYFFKILSQYTKSWLGYDEPTAYFIDQSLSLKIEETQALKREYSGGYPYESPINKGDLFRLWPELQELRSISVPAKKLFINLIKSLDTGCGITTIFDYSPASNNLSLNESIIYCLEELKQNSLIIDNLSFKKNCYKLTHSELNQIRSEYDIVIGGRKEEKINQLDSLLDSKQKNEILQKYFNPNYKYIYINLKNVDILKKFIWAEFKKIHFYFDSYMKSKVTRPMNRNLSPSQFFSWRDEILKVFDNRDWNEIHKKGFEIIRKYWTKELDNLIIETTKKYLWYAYLGFQSIFISYHPDDVYEKYKIECLKAGVTNYYSLALSFGEKRLQELGFVIRDPEEKNCIRCHKPFMEDSVQCGYIIPNVNEIRFCNNCYSKAYQKLGNLKYLSKKTMADRLNKLYNLLEFIPSSGFMKSPQIEFYGDKLDQFIFTLIKTPSYEMYIDKFGSWINALVESRIVDEDGIRSSFGTLCVAKDGHTCFSKAERFIDDWLYLNDIPHDKEPFYPFDEKLNPGGKRADWVIEDVYIEFAGLMNDETYRRNIEVKKTLAQNKGIDLIIIYPDDLGNLEDKLAEKIELEDKIFNIPK